MSSRVWGALAVIAALSIAAWAVLDSKDGAHIVGAPSGPKGEREVIVQAMGVISRSVGNDYISNHVNNMREGIERGESLTRTASRTGMFTPVVMQMFAVGEEAGNLDAEAREKLVEIADKCPVHRTLEQSSAIVTKVRKV